MKEKLVPHKWVNEIKAWAEGREIQWRFNSTDYWRTSSYQCGDLLGFHENYEYRIKPQPKTGWIIVTNGTNYFFPCQIYNSYEEAEEVAKSASDNWSSHRKIIKIEYEE